MRYTLRDPSLTHQIVITWESGRFGGQPAVGCNCTNGTPFGSARDVVEAFHNYNNPDNHVKPFGPEDRINRSL